jgi:hypothetical protein
MSWTWKPLHVLASASKYYSDLLLYSIRSDIAQKKEFHNFMEPNYLFSCLQKHTLVPMLRTQFQPLKNGVFWDVTPCGSCKNHLLMSSLTESLFWCSVVTVMAWMSQIAYFFLQMFDVISDYNSAFSLGRIHRMNGMVCYIVFNLIKDSLVKCVSDIRHMSVFCAQDYL